MRDIDDIYNLYLERYHRLSPMHARALEIRNIVYGDVIVPLPEKDQNERPANANIMLLGLEQTAMRTASTTPVVTTPTVRLGRAAAEERARSRGQVITSWWEQTALDLKMMKRARHLHGYACAPVVVRPDPKAPHPCWYVRDPLTTFPPPMDPGEIHPDDCIFVYTRPYGWFMRNYPDQALKLANGHRLSYDDPIELLEYIDDAEYTLLGIAKKSESPAYMSMSTAAGSRVLALERADNLAGIPLAVVPGRVSLDQPQGQFDGLTGMFQMQSKLMALELIGMERSVYPETWAVSTIAGQPPKIIEVADPISGTIGEIEGGQINTVHVAPEVLGTNFVDRLERNMRVESMTPAEFGGESSTNVRTGRRGDVILSQTVDFQIQTAHRIFERALEAENRVAIAIDKAYYGHTKTVVTASRGEFNYSPSIWETDLNYVRYSHAGADINQLVVAAGQRLGLGTMSRRTFMRSDPMIEDDEAESDQIVVESLEAAVLGSLQQMAAADPSFIEPLAEILKRVQTNRSSLVDAFIDVQNEYKAKQAQAQENPPGSEGALPPEEMQPGVAEPIPSVAEQPEGLQNLTFLLKSLHGNERTAAAG